MASDTGRATESASGGSEVMASIDGVGAARRLIIADVESNDGWLSIPLRNGASLLEWC